MRTLGQFIIEGQANFPYAEGELSRLLRDIGIAARIVNREVNKAGLADIIGDAGTVNIGGAGQQKLDVLVNQQFIAALTSGGECRIAATEEEDDPVLIGALRFPGMLSTSSVCNLAMETIFSIHRKQVVAGYVIYGSSTMLVYTKGKGVNRFTLDPSIGEFCLSHPMMRMPRTSRTGLRQFPAHPRDPA